MYVLQIEYDFKLNASKFALGSEKRIVHGFVPACLALLSFNYETIIALYPKFIALKILAVSL